MEYLMTYGWAILIISVVLASLFSLGVFNAGASLSTTCIALPGYTCATPLLHGGVLTFTVGQATSISWTNTVFYFDPTGTSGCSIGISTLNNGIWSGLTFPSASSNTIAFNGVSLTNAFQFSQSVGTGYSGTIWASYSTPSFSGLCVQLATISLKAV
jgi:hypothetical protein